MKKLYNEIEETVILAVLVNNRCYCLETIGREDGLAFIIKRGSEVPLHCGASGQILLAFSENEDIELFLKRAKLEKYTHKTITDRDRLRKKLSGIKRAGYADSEGELHVGGRAVAVPVFDHLGKICASLSVAGPVQRMTNEKIDKIKNILMKYAKGIKENLMKGG